MKLLAVGSCLALLVGATSARPGGDDTQATDKSTADLFAEVAPGENDPLSIPMNNGIVWYGTWEDAMAEKERTGKPVMLHFGSPRCPKEQKVCVPGTW